MNKFVVLLLSFLVIGCGPTIVATGAKTAVEQQQDDKRDVVSCLPLNRATNCIQRGDSL